LYRESQYEDKEHPGIPVHDVPPAGDTVSRLRRPSRLRAGVPLANAHTPGVDRGDGMNGAAEKLMAFWRLDRHMFVETPYFSPRHADLFDFCECPRPDPRGISETPAQTEAQPSPIVVRQPPDAPYALPVRHELVRMPLTTR
jgi:hypothetical protein